jgi:hypothetical protein
MVTNKTNLRYMGLFDRGYGREAIEIKMDYPFHRSGIVLPPTIAISVDTAAKQPPYYTVVICLLVHGQEEFAKSLGISQQDVSDCMARHRDMQTRLGRNG